MDVNWGNFDDGVVDAILWIALLPLVLGVCGFSLGRRWANVARGFHISAAAIPVAIATAVFFEVVLEEGTLLVHSGRPELAKGIAEGFSWSVCGERYEDWAQSVMLDLSTSILLLAVTIGSLIWHAAARRSSHADVLRVHIMTTLLAITSIATNLVGVFAALQLLTLVSWLGNRYERSAAYLSCIVSDLFLLLGIGFFHLGAGAFDIVEIVSQLRSSGLSDVDAARNGLGLACIVIATLSRIAFAPFGFPRVAGLVVFVRFAPMGVGADMLAVSVWAILAAVVVVRLLSSPGLLDWSARSASTFDRRVLTGATDAVGDGATRIAGAADRFDRGVVEVAYETGTLAAQVLAACSRVVQSGSLPLYLSIFVAAIVAVLFLAFFVL